VLPPKDTGRGTPFSRRAPATLPASPEEPPTEHAFNFWLSNQYQNSLSRVWRAPEAYPLARCFPPSFAAQQELRFTGRGFLECLEARRNPLPCRPPTLHGPSLRLSPPLSFCRHYVPTDSISPMAVKTFSPGRLLPQFSLNFFVGSRLLPVPQLAWPFLCSPPLRLQVCQLRRSFLLFFSGVV